MYVFGGGKSAPQFSRCFTVGPPPPGIVHAEVGSLFSRAVLSREKRHDAQRR